MEKSSKAIVLKSVFCMDERDFNFWKCNNFYGWMFRKAERFHQLDFCGFVFFASPYVHLMNLLFKHYTVVRYESPARDLFILH